MKTNSALPDIFPSNNNIPTTIHLSVQIHQRQILINGELLPWEGPTQPVYSPIYIREASGKLKPALIGSYPLGGPNEAHLALQAAIAAYDGGKVNGQPCPSMNG